MIAMQCRITNATASSSKSASRAVAPQPPVSMLNNRRKLLLGSTMVGLLSLVSKPSHAVGLESVEIPPIQRPGFVEELNKRNQATLDAAEESFQNSELLKSLKDRSEANKDKNKKELFDRYCKRQAELGVGDCGGLRYIPGMTKSGVQERPAWLEKLFGSE